jgi:hypothetical protein
MLSLITYFFLEMATTKRDYYEILGVIRAGSGQHIKCAYCKLPCRAEFETSLTLILGHRE